MKDLQLEAQLSEDEAPKFEELNEQSEAKRAIEFEKLLDKAKVSALKGIQEATAKSTSLKDELERSLNKLASFERENEDLRRQITHVEDKCSQAISENELLVGKNVQLKTKVDELQELLNSAVSEKEATAKELLSHKKTIAELNDSQAKCTELQNVYESRILEVQSQLQEAILRHTAKLNALEGQINHYKEQAREAVATSETHKMRLDVSLQEKKRLETAVEELQNNSLHELEQKITSLEEHLKEFAASQRNVELEEFIQAPNSAAEEAKSQLREMEACFIAAERKNDLEQQLNEAEREMRCTVTELVEHLEEITTEAEREKNLLSSQMQGYLEKVTQLESDLNQSSLRSEELEQQISILEQKCSNSEADAKNHLDNVSNLTAKLEEFQAGASRLELALQTAIEKERLLKESLTAVTGEKKKLEDAFNGLNEKLAETKNLLEADRNSQPPLTYSRKKTKVQG